MLLALTMSVAINLQPYMAVEQSALDWNIARDLSGADTPNILSELEFIDISSRRYGVAGNVVREVGGAWQAILAVDAAYLDINRGTMWDADFAGDNRTGLYSLSRASISGEGGYWLSGALGLRYQWAVGQALSLLLGAYQHQQTLNFRHGRQVVADPNFYSTADLRQINTLLQDHLDSSYLSEWQGNYVQLAYQWQKGSWLSEWGFKFQAGNYYGEGHWNLREDLQQPRSFSHFVDSTGYNFNWQLQYKLTESLSAFGDLHYRQRQSDAGVGVSFLADGSLNATRFNQVEWESKELRLGLAYQW